MGFPPNVTDGQRSASPAPSLRSDGSMGFPPNMEEEGRVENQGHHPTYLKVEEHKEEEGKGEEQWMQSVEYLKSNVKTRLQHLHYGSKEPDNPSFVSNIYTKLYILARGKKEVSDEHEVRQIERSSRGDTAPVTGIHYSDIFQPLPGQQEHIRTVLTMGIAGIGKTVTVQRFILDWAENRANQDIQLMLLVSFRELNMLKRRLLSLTELLQQLGNDIRDVEMLHKSRVLVILDGLDESRITLNFQSKEMCSSITEHTSVDVLLTNLIKGNLLPSALIWITTRPAAASQIPPECFDRVTELRGFSDLQKDEYFKKRISDDDLVERIITHLKSSRVLYIMCHIPVFSWIAATVLERLLTGNKEEKIPRTVTQMYIHFLIMQTNVSKQKYTERKETDKGTILKLGKLAFQQMEKGNLIFYEGDLRECGIDVKEASVYSGVCTQIFNEETGLYQGRLFSFVHLSIQEFLAALYAHISFLEYRINVLTPTMKPKARHRRRNLCNLHKDVIDRALQSHNGHLDLFLRFLLGCSREGNKELLKRVFGMMERTKGSDSTLRYLRNKIKDNLSTEKSINLFHCLNELSYGQLVEEVQRFLCLNIIPRLKLSSDQWAVLVFILLTSENDLSTFDLGQYMDSNTVLEKLMPVVKQAKTLRLKKCNLTEKSWEALVVVIQSPRLEELDLGGTHLQHCHVKHLCSALTSANCKLKRLKLNGCKLNEESCAAVVAAVSAVSDNLIELDMSHNQLGDATVMQLSRILANTQCQLQELRLGWCGVKEEGFRHLAAALRVNPSHLKELDLSMSMPGDTGIDAFCTALSESQCSLQVLKLNKCELTHSSCSSLAALIRSESSGVLELHLSDNNLQDAGVKTLAEALSTPGCKLQVLRLYNCGISERGCGYLAEALKVHSSGLRELYLDCSPAPDCRVNPLMKLQSTLPLDRQLEKLDIKDS
ncbi:NACHT, LRR and PYD domains-containing protein 12-like isoform X2 [Engraulis encrasicolus]|uniref:NACHT, LRR and PYD domains-containing protein 12-like isoform X2 n=1 Tax=Engraulis encrasicolus TaxID=184585 RepID=UPI002FD780B3